MADDEGHAGKTLAEWNSERVNRCRDFARSHTLTVSDSDVVMGVLDRFFERARTDAWLFEHAAHPWFRFDALYVLMLKIAPVTDLVRAEVALRPANPCYRLFGELYWHYEQAVLPVVTRAGIATVMPVPDLIAIIQQYVVCGMVNQVRRQLALDVLDHNNLDSRLSSIHNLPYLRARRVRPEKECGRENCSDAELDRLHAADMLLDRFAPIAHDIVSMCDELRNAPKDTIVLVMRLWFNQQAHSILKEAKTAENVQRSREAFSIVLKSRRLFSIAASVEGNNDDAPEMSSKRLISHCAAVEAHQRAIDAFRADPMGDSCEALMVFRQEIVHPLQRLPDFQSMLTTWLAVKYFAATTVCPDSIPTL